MTTTQGLTPDEINRAIELLKKAGINSTYSIKDYETDLYTTALKAEEKMIKEIKQRHQELEDHIEWKRQDLKEDKEIARRVRRVLGLED
ncbi:hypothetical protein JMG10_36495 [Nostoc ellipsosporum NOK]|nr:hypothetical protein [Nostoc ellipsosporum NOK]